MFMLSPPRVKLPALTWMMLVPADFSERLHRAARARCRAPTMAITAATPMITPSMVSAVRRRLRPSARSAICAQTMSGAASG